MKLGYACLTLGVPNVQFKTLTLKNISRDRLKILIENNLLSLENILKYNLDNDIKLFRICSDIIPFGSSIHNSIQWWDLYSNSFQRLSSYIQDNDIRVSMHPGQYTIINSPHEEVLANSYQDLIYHNRVLDSLAVDTSCKIILHIGGIYQDKKSAIRRFIENYSRLDDNIKKRIAIENDDRYYNVEDVLNISNKINVPVVYDSFHNLINPVDKCIDDNYWINETSATWKPSDGTTKVHYSQQAKDKRAGSHSQTILADDFLAFYNNISNLNIDIMLEVKDKNISCIKCKNLIEYNDITNLDLEWNRYKYRVLEQSPLIYYKVGELLKNKDSYPNLEFYKLIEQADKIKPSTINCIHTALHVWGFFKTFATDNECAKFNNYLKKFSNNNLSLLSLKKYLYGLSVKYNQDYLLNSYYFI